MTWSEYLRGRLEEINAHLTTIERTLTPAHESVHQACIPTELPLLVMPSSGKNDHLLRTPENITN